MSKSPKSVLFTPLNVTEHHRCYDYVEPLRKQETPVLSVETEWEVEKGIQWSTVLRSRIDGKYKMWYQAGFRNRGKDEDVIIDNEIQGVWRKVVCYAESDDGVHWKRPHLDLFFGDRFPGNNIVVDWEGYLLDSPSVVEDLEDPDESRRYKLLIYHLDLTDPTVTGGCLFFSPDGIHFTFSGIHLPTQDAECLWYDSIHQRYLAFLKDRYGENRIRLITHSNDCLTWSEPSVLFKPDAGDDKGTNFYQQTAFAMNDRCLGFLNIFDVTTQMSWLELVESPDGLSWHRLPSKTAVLRQGDFGSLDGGGVYCGLCEPIVDGERTWVYYFAAPHPHDSGVSDKAMHLKSSVARAWFPTGRLLGQQTERGGFFATVPVLCPGGELQLNYTTAAEIRVELKDPGYGDPIEGFAAKDCLPLSGDETATTVQWKDGVNLNDLEGRYVKIKLYGDNLKAFSATFV